MHIYRLTVLQTPCLLFQIPCPPPPKKHLHPHLCHLCACDDPSLTQALEQHREGCGLVWILKQQLNSSLDKLVVVVGQCQVLQHLWRGLGKGVATRWGFCNNCCQLVCGLQPLPPQQPLWGSGGEHIGGFVGGGERGRAEGKTRKGNTGRPEGATPP